MVVRLGDVVCLFWVVRLVGWVLGMLCVSSLVLQGLLLLVGCFWVCLALGGLLSVGGDAPPLALVVFSRVRWCDVCLFGSGLAGCFGRVSCGRGAAVCAWRVAWFVAVWFCVSAVPLWNCLSRP